MQVVVLGMHRSGTSATGQLLQAMGLQFGPADTALLPGADNPKGFAERYDVRSLNDLALADQGARWDMVGGWKAGASSELFQAEFDRCAGEIIASYPSDKPWFVKDPRMCVTLPLWDKFFEDPVYLLVYRDPVEIARSLWVRGRMPQRASMALWERHLADALTFTQGKRRILIQYAELIESPQSVTRQLITGLNRFGFSLPTAVPEELPVDGSLRHHFRLGNALEQSFTASQARLNQALKDGSALDWSHSVDVSRANRELLACQEALDCGNLSYFFLEGSEGKPEAKPESCDQIEKGLDRVHEKLEIIHSLALYFEKRFAKNGRGAGINSTFTQLADEVARKDHALRTLLQCWEELSRWNPLRSAFRKARRRSKLYLAQPEDLQPRSVRSEVARKMLPPPFPATQRLLGKLLMDRAPAGLGVDLDARLGDENLEKLIAEVRCELSRLRGYAERGSDPEDLVPHLREQVKNRERNIGALLQSGEVLAKGTPFGSEFRRTAKAFRKAKGAVEKSLENSLVTVMPPSERFVLLSTAVKEAENALDAIFELA